MSSRSKKLKEDLDKDSFGAATVRVVFRVVIIYVIFWILQRLAGNP